MAKRNQNNLSGITREQIIKNCNKCKGNPIIGTCTLQGVAISYCDRADCMEVINYTGNTNRIQEKKQIVQNITEEVIETKDKAINNEKQLIMINL